MTKSDKVLEVMNRIDENRGTGYANVNYDGRYLEISDSNSGKVILTLVVRPDRLGKLVRGNTELVDVEVFY